MSRVFPKKIRLARGIATPAELARYQKMIDAPETFAGNTHPADLPVVLAAIRKQGQANLDRALAHNASLGAPVTPDSLDFGMFGDGTGNDPRKKQDPDGTVGREARAVNAGKRAGAARAATEAGVPIETTANRVYTAKDLLDAAEKKREVDAALAYHADDAKFQTHEALKGSSLEWRLRRAHAAAEKLEAATTDKKDKKQYAAARAQIEAALKGGDAGSFFGSKAGQAALGADYARHGTPTEGENVYTPNTAKHRLNIDFAVHDLVKRYAAHAGLHHEDLLRSIASAPQQYTKLLSAIAKHTAVDQHVGKLGGNARLGAEEVSDAVQRLHSYVVDRKQRGTDGHHATEKFFAESARHIPKLKQSGLATTLPKDSRDPLKLARSEVLPWHAGVFHLLRPDDITAIKQQVIHGARDPKKPAARKFEDLKYLVNRLLHGTPGAAEHAVPMLNSKWPEFLPLLKMIGRDSTAPETPAAPAPTASTITHDEHGPVMHNAPEATAPLSDRLFWAAQSVEHPDRAPLLARIAAQLLATGHPVQHDISSDRKIHSVLSDVAEGKYKHDRIAPLLATEKLHLAPDELRHVVSEKLRHISDSDKGHQMQQKLRITHS